MFAGMGVVGAYFKNRVKKLIANDIEPYSFVLNSHYIKNALDKNYLESLAKNILICYIKKVKFLNFMYLVVAMEDNILVMKMVVKSIRLGKKLRY